MEIRNLSVWLQLAYLFMIGSIFGWIIELFYRRFALDNKEGKWVNPGFLTGPYIPLYGFALCILFVLANFGEKFIAEGSSNKIILFVIMAICITIIEYIAGVICIKLFNVRLWDYSKEFLNIQGIVCIKFSFYWWLLSAFYYFLINDKILKSLIWLDHNIEFSFWTGIFYGVFVVDLCQSLNVITRLRTFARENKIIVVYERFQDNAKETIQSILNKNKFFTGLFLDNKILSEVIELYKQRFQKGDEKINK